MRGHHDLRYTDRFESFGKGYPSAKNEEPSKLVLRREPSQNGHRATLTKATEDDTRGWDSSIDFGSDELRNALHRCAHSNFVFRAIAAEAVYVEP